MVKSKKGNLFLTILFTVICLLWVFPVVEVVLNSFKRKAYISREPFGLPTGKMFEGIQNYVNGIEKTNFFRAFGLSLLVTVLSVAVLLLCTSMCAWYIVRVKSVISSVMFYGFVFSMIVPFQMVMFTLSKIANMLKLTTPLGLVLVYLGFGAGLCVFMFTGFVQSIPLEIEESAMIDGCNPIQAYFRIVLPIMKPTCITVAILEAMWIWNDYLLPLLVLDSDYQTIPIAIQYLKGGHGSVDMGAMMATLVLSIIPIVIFYMICQKHIIEGVVAGAVKG